MLLHPAGEYQIGLLTQLYSVSVLHIGSFQKHVFLQAHKDGYADLCAYCSKPDANAAFMYLFSSESNVRGKIEVEEALQGSRSETKELPEGTKRNTYMVYNEGS